MKKTKIKTAGILIVAIAGLFWSGAKLNTVLDRVDEVRGEWAKEGPSAFLKCRACHDARASGEHRIGPNLWNALGRKKASAPDYAFSDALKRLGGTWTEEDMSAFLTAPKAFAPGTTMAFGGLPDPRDRAAVISYMRTLRDADHVQ